MTLSELLYPLYKTVAFRFDPELIHHLSISALSTIQRLGLLSSVVVKQQPVECLGLSFPNIVGVAAGLDKNGVCVDAFSSLGFGFVEVGTITPRAQQGNEKPRLFRLLADQAIVNRMGFNNCGVEQLIKNLRQQKRSCVVGINIGKNKDTTEESAINDYLICLDKVYQLADYVTINISSPNTPGLREFGEGSKLGSLLTSLKEKQLELSKLHNKYVPLVLKISPDMSDQQIISTVELIIETKIDGVIATNTTITRDNLICFELGKQAGGLSGKPLTKRSTEVIKIIRDCAKDLPIIAVGGIFTKEDAQDKLNAGANLLQLYTGFIYRGPRLLREILT